MKTRSLSLAAVLAGLLLAGCSTIDSRIAKNRADFDTWPEPVQGKIIKGQVDIGFTREQVRVALGEPDRVFTRTTADGTSEIWSYRDRGPRFSFGVGVGSFGSRSATSVGLGVGTGGGYRDDEKMGVVFDRNGQVATIETRQRGR